MVDKSVCPNCGRKLTEDELYCHFCELDLGNLFRQNEKSENNKK